MIDRSCRAHRSEEHTSELQSHDNLVCRLLLEKKKHYDIRRAFSQQERQRRVGTALSRARPFGACCAPASAAHAGRLSCCFFCLLFFYNNRAPPEPHPLPPPRVPAV